MICYDGDEMAIHAASAKTTFGEHTFVRILAYCYVMEAYAKAGSVAEQVGVGDMK